MPTKGDFKGFFKDFPHSVGGVGWFVAVALFIDLLVIGHTFLGVFLGIAVLFACASRFHGGKAEGIEGTMTRIAGPNWREGT